MGRRIKRRGADDRRDDETAGKFFPVTDEKRPLPALSAEGMRIGLGVAPLERIEQIRRA